VSESTVIWMGILSLVTFLVSLLALPWLVSQIPKDYFNYQNRSSVDWESRSPSIRIPWLVAKNLLGWVLLAGGAMMLFLPGQGLLTMAMGLVLMDYPGKYQLERRLVSVPLILKGLNWLRAKRNVPPLELTD
jgi:Putative transmembrane protein (PGPGW)